MIVFINGQFVDEDKASLRLNDLSIQRGYGAFDFFRTRNYIPLFLDDYLHRFFNSMDGMHLPSPHSKEELKSIIHELINKNYWPDAGVRLLITGGYSADGYELSTPNFIITQHKIQLTDTTKFNNGIKVITHEYLRDLPEIKSVNYLVGVWLQQKVKEQGAADVLYHKQGIVSEFPRSNIFIVKDDTLITPADNVLPGITRKKLIDLARQKCAVELRPVELHEVYNADEVFMTSTTKRLLPITTIDDTVIGNGQAGPITSLLNDAFIEMEEEYLSVQLEK
ncbi:aminotransferase class IV [Terrimonas pollutisoli]|uniref:aminotransferase class IV n=1 Tax=Terrimonas pollutisoli TaxID=3034147 RepID=UPI0023ECE7E4|nr:aminotransferase class IV [Terrimonas sp. H1YJ31]